jgi:hypothetical protein
MEQISINIHRETDLLGLARAEKKRDYWQKVSGGILPLPAEANTGYAEERLIYWIEQAEKYRERIEKHIDDFKKVQDTIGFIAWISSIVETIRTILKLVI